MEGRGVLKSTLTMLSVLGERMKARDPRRSPYERICLHKPGQGAPRAAQALGQSGQSLGGLQHLDRVTSQPGERRFQSP